MNSEKKIIIMLVIFLIGSFNFLFYMERKNIAIANAVGWELYFAEPKSSDALNFVVKNGGEKVKFNWKELLENGTAVKTGEIELLAGEEKEITLEKKKTRENVLIEVSGGGGKKEIYKR